MSSKQQGVSESPDLFADKYVDCWRRMPDKSIFFVLLAAWFALFHFLGNSTLGYVKTPSLFGWWFWVNTCGLGMALVARHAFSIFHSRLLRPAREFHRIRYFSSALDRHKNHGSPGQRCPRNWRNSEWHQHLGTIGPVPVRGCRRVQRNSKS